MSEERFPELTEQRVILELQKSGRRMVGVEKRRVEDLLRKEKELHRLTKLGPMCFATDDDGHTYLIPSSKRDSWDHWLDSDMAANGDAPYYAQRVDNPSFIDFYLKETK